MTESDLAAIEQRAKLSSRVDDMRDLVQVMLWVQCRDTLELVAEVRRLRALLAETTLLYIADDMWATYDRR